MTRITEKNLDARANVLNSLFKVNPIPYIFTGQSMRSNEGTFLISKGYGGYCLERISNNVGGVRDVFRCGHIPARQLFDLMGAYIYGIYDAQKIPA